MAKSSLYNLYLLSVRLRAASLLLKNPQAKKEGRSQNNMSMWVWYAKLRAVSSAHVHTTRSSRLLHSPLILYVTRTCSFSVWIFEQKRDCSHSNCQWAFSHSLPIDYSNCDYEVLVTVTVLLLEQSSLQLKGSRVPKAVKSTTQRRCLRHGIRGK